MPGSLILSSRRRRRPKERMNPTFQAPTQERRRSRPRMARCIQSPQQLRTAARRVRRRLQAGARRPTLTGATPHKPGMAAKQVRRRPATSSPVCPPVDDGPSRRRARRRCAGAADLGIGIPSSRRNCVRSRDDCPPGGPVASAAAAGQARHSRRRSGVPKQDLGSRGHPRQQP